MIQETIFENNSNKVKMKGSISSFSDCPNNCIDGYYIDPYKHKRIKCLYCEEKRKQLAQNKLRLDGGNNIRKLLNLPISFAGYGNFSIDLLIPEKLQKDMKEDSIRSVSDILSKLLNDASVGTASEESLLINLGLNAYPSNFIYSYLMRAYISGMTVSPYLTARDVFLLLKYETEDNDTSILDLGDSVSIKYKDLLTTDVCVIHITTGADYNHIRAVKGLLQMRAHNDKSTIIFTDAWWFTSSSKHEIYLKRTLESLYSDDVLSKAVARLIKVSYNISEDKIEKQKELSKFNSSTNTSIAGMSKKQLDDLLRPNERL